VPLLIDCPNRLVAERVALLDEGSDHVCLVLQPTTASARTPFRPLRLSQVEHLQPGHESEERPQAGGGTQQLIRGHGGVPTGWRFVPSRWRDRRSGTPSGRTACEVADLVS